MLSRGSFARLLVYAIAQDHAFPKISTVHYSSEGADVGRHCLSSPRCACMHVRMPMGEGCVKDDLVHPYPPHTATGIFKRGLHFGPLFVGRGSSAADEWDVWERVILPQMAKILITTVLLAREGEPLTLHKILQQADPQVHYRRVLLLSPDFIVDEAGVSAILPRIPHAERIPGVLTVALISASLSPRC